MTHQEKEVNFLLKATGNGYPSHQPSKSTFIECANCGEKTSFTEEDLKENGGFLTDRDDIYCSESCRYNAETGHPGEEY